MSFEEWMKQVDRELKKECGMVSDDLPDYLYRDAYDAGDSPDAVAKASIENMSADILFDETGEVI